MKASSRRRLKNDGEKTNERSAFYWSPNLSPGSHSNPLCRVQSHEYINICLVYWTVIFHGEAKKGNVPSEIQRLNPSLGSRQYSERSIKACLPDLPFRSCTYTSIEVCCPSSDPASRLCYLVRCSMNLFTSLNQYEINRTGGWMKRRTRRVRLIEWIFSYMVTRISWTWERWKKKNNARARGVFRILDSTIDQ